MRPQVHLVVPDVHTPFQNDTLVNKVCLLARDIRPDGIVFLGDFLDLFTLSKYSEDSLYQLKDLTLSDEYDAGREVLSRFLSALPRGCQKVFIYGNHEDRHFRELQKKDHAKYGKELTPPDEALRLHERKFTVLTDWKSDSFRLGLHLELIHGTFCGVHTAKRHLDEFEGSAMMGHSHRFQTYVTGKRGSYNIGFLGQKDSKGFAYCARATRQKWVNGFAVVYVMADGSFIASPVSCWNDQFIFNGKLY